MVRDAAHAIPVKDIGVYQDFQPVLRQAMAYADVLVPV
jgi:hypothetical protein